jgi:lipopolysaccharide/colanic/teichoic acid biosynthesis glycosyltransferase
MWLLTVNWSVPQLEIHKLFKQNFQIILNQIQHIILTAAFMIIMKIIKCFHYGKCCVSDYNDAHRAVTFV